MIHLSNIVHTKKVFQEILKDFFMFINVVIDYSLITTISSTRIITFAIMIIMYENNIVGGGVHKLVFGSVDVGSHNHKKDENNNGHDSITTIKTT